MESKTIKLFTVITGIIVKTHIFCSDHAYFKIYILGVRNAVQLVFFSSTRFLLSVQLVFSLSSTCFLLQDGCVSNCTRYHVISIQPLSLIFMDNHQFDRHALSLYRFYRERGCSVTFQLWTTEDGGEHFKI